MATLICNATGNLTGASTFATSETGALAAVLNRNTIESLAAAATVTSATFTVTTAHVIDAVLLFVRVAAASPTGTFKVDLQKGAVSQASVTVNKADLPQFFTGQAIGNMVPVLFKLGSTATGDGAANWTIVLTTTGTVAVNYAAATASTTNFTRALRTTTAATPAAADDLYIIGELTGASTHTARVVTMDSTAATAYGSGSVNSTTVAGGGIHTGYYGSFTYGITASTNYVLRIAGDLWVWEQGPLSIGASGAEMPRNSSAVLEFQIAGASGDFGLRIMDNATLNIAGLSRTAVKNIVKCKLTSNVSAAGTTFNIDTDTGWLSGDVVCVGSTTRTIADCESLTLTGNASASAFTTTGGAAAAHSGTSPTQASIGLLTRNVKIRSTSSTLVSYLYCTALSTVTASWAEFSAVGVTGVVQKRGIEIDGGTTANAKSFTFCSLHDCVSNGLQLNAASVTSLNVTFSNNVLYSSANNSFITLSGLVTNNDWTMDSNLVVKASAASSFLLSSVGGICTNNIAVGSAAIGFSLTDATSPAATLGNFDGNSANCCNHGMTINSSLIGTISNFTGWRNNTDDLQLAGTTSADLVFNNPTLFGGASQNMNVSSDVINITGASVMAGDTTFATSVGIQIASSRVVVLNMSGVDMSGVGSIYAVHTSADFSTPTTNYTVIEGTANSCKFGAASLFSSKTKWSKNSSVGFEKYGQTASDHRTELTYGQLKTDTSIFNTASPSMRMTPNNASNKLESAPRGMGWKVPVSSGNTAAISVYLYKSKTGDGAAYTGNQPRLIQRANAALGQTSDVVLGTYSASTGSWNQLSANTSTATDDGAWEIIVDCDGTAGWINVDDLQVA